MVDSKINRRKMMKAVGSVSFGAGFLGQSKVTAALEDRTVNSLSGNSRAEVLKNAKNDAEFKQILSEFRKSGANPKYNNSIVKEAIPKDGPSYNTVVVPFQLNGEDKKQINLLWMSRSVGGTQLPRVLGHVADDGYIESLKSATTSSSPNPNWNFSMYTVNNGKINIEEKSMEGGTSPSTSDNINPGGGSEEGCEVEIVDCNSWDWTCVVSIASALAGTVASCVACIPDPTKITCGLCLLGIFGGAAGTYDCAQNGKHPLRDECTRTTKWIAKSNLPPHFNYPSQCSGS